MNHTELAALRPLLARWNHAIRRAREEYEAAPDAAARYTDHDCGVPYCGRPKARAGLCYRHDRMQQRDRGEVGA